MPVDRMDLGLVPWLRLEWEVAVPPLATSSMERVAALLTMLLVECRDQGVKSITVERGRVRMLLHLTSIDPETYAKRRAHLLTLEERVRDWCAHERSVPVDDDAPEENRVTGGFVWRFTCDQILTADLDMVAEAIRVVLHAMRPHGIKRTVVERSIIEVHTNMPTSAQELEAWGARMMEIENQIADWISGTTHTLHAREGVDLGLPHDPTCGVKTRI